jgi:hypothetical protein
MAEPTHRSGGESNNEDCTTCCRDSCGSRASIGSTVITKQQIDTAIARGDLVEDEAKTLSRGA